MTLFGFLLFVYFLSSSELTKSSQISALKMSLLGFAVKTKPYFTIEHCLNPVPALILEVTISEAILLTMVEAEFSVSLPAGPGACNCTAQCGKKCDLCKEKPMFTPPMGLNTNSIRNSLC